MATKKNSKPRLVPVADPAGSSAESPPAVPASPIAHLRPAPRPLAETDERLTPGRRGQTEIEHFHRYLLARGFCAGRDVLDVAAGEGYGCALLGEVAASVVGVEIDPAVVAHAEASHAGPNVRFLQGDALALPLTDASVDVVVSFETLEHLDDQDRFLAEITRVLRPGGLLVLSTPDRLVYSPPGTPPNPYHRRELTREEFASLLGRHFRSVAFARQQALVGSAILPEGQGAGPVRVIERLDDTSFDLAATGDRAPYLLALASPADVPPWPASLYIDTGDLLRQDRQVEEARAAAARVAAERDQARSEAAMLRAALAARSEPAEPASAQTLTHLAAARDDMARRLDGLLARQAAIEEARFAAVREAESRATEAAVTAGAREALAAALAAERDRYAALLAQEREALAAARADLAEAEIRAQVNQALLAEREGRVQDLLRQVRDLEVRQAEMASRSIATDLRDAHAASLEARLSQMQGELDEARAQAADHRRVADEEAHARASAERSVADLSRRLEEREREVADLLEQAALREAFLGERDELLAERAAWAVIESLHEETVAGLEARLDQAGRDKAGSMEELRDAEDRLASAQAELERLRIDLAEAGAREAADAEQLRARELELDETRRTLDRVAADLRRREDEWAGRDQAAARGIAHAEAERDAALRLLRQQRMVHARLQREYLAAADVRAGALTLMARRARFLRLLPRPVKRLLKWMLFGKEGAR